MAMCSWMKKQFPLSIEAGAGHTGFTGDGAGYHQSGQNLAEAMGLSRTRMVARLAGMPVQALITTDETGSTVDDQLISGEKLFRLRQPLALDATLKDLEKAVERALGLTLPISLTTLAS